MLHDKTVLEQYLEKESIKIVVDKEKSKTLYNYMNDTYQIPKSLTADLISCRKSFSEVSEFILFCLLDSIEKTIGVTTSSLDKYFTMQEVQTYRKAKYEVETIKFPLVFKMVEIRDDQWIGKITVNQLMDLRKTQLINYNVNAQRTMQKIIKGAKEFYKIALNWNAIRQIVQSFMSSQYIPNTLTLNIPRDTESDFYYDEESSSLVINKLQYFDITDGYHRYISACQIKDKDDSFNYDMELRIVNFSDDKAKQFIFQEDQKTKMRKLDSNSLNMTKAANIVVSRMNEDTRCNLQGLISRNDGLISFGEFAEVIDYFYFREVKTKEKEKIAVINVTKKLINDFNFLTEYNTKYLEEKYTFLRLIIITYCFCTYADKKREDICRIIEYVDSKSENIDKKKISTKIRKSLINEIDQLTKECGL